MSDHTRTVIFDQVTIMLHLISSDEFHGQVILEHLTFIGKSQVFIETDVIKA